MCLSVILSLCLFLFHAVMVDTTVGPWIISNRDQPLFYQVLQLHSKDQDIKISELKALVEHQITKFYELKALVEHQNTKFEKENVKLAEKNTKICKLESKIEELINSQAAKTTTATTTSSPQTSTSSANDTSSAGVVFTRWGRTDCPAGISTPVYNGTVGGSHYKHTGAAVNRLCMPHDPLWDANKLYKSSYSGYVYGGKYGSGLPDSSLKYHVTPCAVCRAASFSTKVMIPGRDRCYPGWTKAYHGELTSGRTTATAATEYDCLDRQPQKGIHTSSVDAFEIKTLHIYKSCQ